MAYAYLSVAIGKLVKRLYIGFAEVPLPLPSGRTPQRERNQQIMQLRQQGLSYGELAARFGLSEQRIAQILSGRRK